MLKGTHSEELHFDCVLRHPRRDPVAAVAFAAADGGALVELALVERVEEGDRLAHTAFLKWQEVDSMLIVGPDSA